MLSNVFFSGQKGRLHGKFYDSRQKNGQYVLLLPDVKQGVENILNDQELFKLFKIFTELEFSVLILNYRGCGRSQGEIKEDKDAVMDASFAADWIQENAKDLQSFWVCGLQYGAYVAHHIARRRPEITDLIMYRAIFNAKYNFDFSDFTIFNSLICTEEDQKKKLDQVLEKYKQEVSSEKMSIFYFDKDNREKIQEDVKSYILENLAMKVIKKVTKRRRRRAGKILINKKK